MKKTLLVIAGLILLLAIIGFVVGPIDIMMWWCKPKHTFDQEKPIPAPDYSLESNWASLPSIDDLADMRPAGVTRDTLMDEVDVFFIHPTGFLKGHTWNSTMDSESSTEENTQWMMANQASAYSDGRVYAPRYREATIFSFFGMDNPDEKAALDLAYDDVSRSFNHFIDHYNQGRPFILASHSQGSFHGFRLLKEKISGSYLADRMVAAYLIGMGTITDEAVAGIEDIPVCDDPSQTHCLIHWATYAEENSAEAFVPGKLVCVNPLSWRRDGETSKKELHLGYVPQTGAFTLEFMGKDISNDIKFEPLSSPHVQHTRATCKDGKLLVVQQDAASDLMGTGDYHGLDYQLFHMNIRKNIGDRYRKFRMDRIAFLNSRDEES
ncbi:MAG: DUF3089 domain-containing protein [Bacteroidia bacterium]|nr:DUF3089 domain-containing protein [Bacteroidia bacterium]